MVNLAKKILLMIQFILCFYQELFLLYLIISLNFLLFLKKILIEYIINIDSLIIQQQSQIIFDIHSSFTLCFICIIKILELYYYY